MQTKIQKIFLTKLSAGHPLICSMKPGDFITSGHFIVLASINENEEILIKDPNSLSNTEKCWKIEVLLPQIKKAWSYSLNK